MTLRTIAPLALARFRRPRIPGNPSLPVRALWYLVNAAVMNTSVAGLVPSRAKRGLLRLFGARVGRGVVIKPRVDIKSPWFLEVGDHAWIGERVWIDNHTTVTVGANACISQGACLFTGNHDWTDPAFAFFCRPVTVGAGAWVTAFQRLGPGTTVPPHTAVVGEAA